MGLSTGYTRALTKSLKEHDRYLFAVMADDGLVHVLRQSHKGLDFVMALTSDWTVRGERRAWGIEPIVNKLRAMDVWTRGDFLNEVFQHNERMEESSDRARRNDMESFLYDYRRQFAKAFDGVNTSTLEKIDKRKELENGNH